jgi:hypothetical protein
MKESYYFPHDYHARHDPKLEKLRIMMGCEGLGIYWCLVEMLYEEGGSLLLADLEIYAKNLNTTPEKVKSAIEGYGLFRKNGTHFYSISLRKRLAHINTKREKARTSANTRWDAKAMPTQCQGNAIKESKVKESKEYINTTAIPPPSAALIEAMNKIKADGLNIYSLLNKLHKLGVGFVPEETLLKICGNYWQKKPYKPWPWFVAAIWREWQDSQHEAWKKEPVAECIKDIIANITNKTQNQE